MMWHVVSIFSREFRRWIGRVRACCSILVACVWVLAISPDARGLKICEITKERVTSILNDVTRNGDSFTLCYRMTLGSVTLGYVTENVRKDMETGEFVFCTRGTVRTRMRNGTSESSFEKSIWIDSSNFQVRKIHGWRKDGASKTEFRGATQGESLHLTISGQDGNSSKSLQSGDYFTSDLLASMLFAASRADDTRKMTFSAFDTKLLGLNVQTYSLERATGSGDSIAEPGLRRINVSDELHGKNAYWMVCNDLGFPETLEYTSSRISLRRCSQSEVSKSVTGYANLADFGRISVNKGALGENCNRHLRVKVWFADGGDVSSFFPEDGRQKLKRERNAVILDIDAQGVPQGHFVVRRFINNNSPMRDTRISPSAGYSNENTFRLAREIVGDETDAWLACRKLLRWVGIAIHPRRGSFTEQASALTALRTMSGDCSERAVVFYELAQLLEIPVRVCMGVKYVKEEGFVYHMWNEVLLNEWIAVDPAITGGVVNATYIALWKGKSSPDEIAKMNSKLEAVFGRLRMEVLSDETVQSGAESESRLK